MASVVCQGLKPSLEPPLIESMVLTHKSSSKPSQLHQISKTEANSVIDSNGERASKNNGFSFFNVLENPSSNCVKNEEAYVHPMVKRSASTLSTMSLEMCTESLGTETGSDVSESSDEFNWEEREKYGRLQRSKVRNFHRKVASYRGGFPPPLTSISGSDGTVKVTPRREGGRLVIKAVSVSDCGTKFEAERTDGRLRLSLLKDCCETGMKVEGGEEDSCDADVEDGGWWWEVDGRNSKRPIRVANSFEDSSEFRLSSCKDGGNGNKGIGNWSLFRVVIS
ncbi:hypothetical protein L1887_13205 [Cichorium endivia]|nr:hypothetical protein L1887_13205 [Cichorium endivia]